MSQSLLTIYFYPAWYPHRNDPMFGLFVQRHAEAVAQILNVGVVFALGENREQGPVYELVAASENGVETVRIYFKKSKLPLFKSLINGYRYLNAVRKGYIHLNGVMGLPDVNHVHVLTRAGIFPLFLHSISGAPYLITEHWSRYLPQNKGDYKGFLRIHLTRVIVKRATSVSPVSRKLAEAMQAHGLKNPHYTLVNNVVDTSLFTPEPKGNQCLKWVHVSCFDDKPKNISGLLHAFADAHKQNPQLSLTLIGDGIDFENMQKLAYSLTGNSDCIRFTGLMQGKAIAEELRKHEGFVMFSRYENQPVVITEAFACGLPVVATAVGAIPEMLENGRGTTVESENEQQLTQTLLDYAAGKVTFSREDIRKYAVENHSMEAVGNRFFELYIAALQRNTPDL